MRYITSKAFFQAVLSIVGDQLHHGPLNKVNDYFEPK